MRTFGIGYGVMFGLGLAAGLAAKIGQTPTFTPKPGDTAVIYTHKFDKATWPTARKDFLAHLWKEIKADKTHLRDSYILESPERAEIVGITLWRSPKDLAEWDALRERNKNVKELDKVGHHPISEARYTLLGDVIE